MLARIGRLLCFMRFHAWFIDTWRQPNRTYLGPDIGWIDHMMRVSQWRCRRCGKWEDREGR
jgi:hypothetical protein